MLELPDFFVQAAWLLCTVSLAFAVSAHLCCGWNPFIQQASYGSGENPIWNSFIDSNPPLPNSRKLRTKYEWRFKGCHGLPGTPGKPGKDYLTGNPVTGHLIGRHVWVPDQLQDRSDQYASFDASKNPVSNFRELLLHLHSLSALLLLQNSGDKVFRSQQLQKFPDSHVDKVDGSVDSSIKRVRVSLMCW